MLGVCTQCNFWRMRPAVAGSCGVLQPARLGDIEVVADQGDALHRWKVHVHQLLAEGGEVWGLALAGNLFSGSALAGRGDHAQIPGS